MPSTHAVAFDHARPPQVILFNPARVLPTRPVLLKLARDTQLVVQGDPADYHYRVSSGCLRSLRLLDDGRRQIGEFLLPGDIFGWESLDEHEFGAEAVTDLVVERFPAASLAERMQRDLATCDDTSRHLAAQVRRARQHVVLLGRSSAAERIAAFLLDMSGRLASGPDRTVTLPMNRIDIADYLGLTIETVCRRLMDLHRTGVIQVDRSRIAILRPAALQVRCCA